MVNFQKIEKQLQMLNKYLDILKQLSRLNQVEFIEDPRNYGSAERFLQLSIETTLNIGNHIISTHNFEAPQDYSDIFLILGKHDVLPKDFADELAKYGPFSKPSSSCLLGGGCRQGLQHNSNQSWRF